MAVGEERSEADGRPAGGKSPAGEESPAMEATVDRLRTELEGLRSAMRTRAVIEQAKGLLVGRVGCTPEEAFGELVRRSQQQNRKLAQIAADLVAAAAPRPAARTPENTETDVPSAARPGADALNAAAPDLAAADEAPVRPSARADREAELATRYHLAAAAAATAGNADELAERLHRAVLAPLGAQAVVLAAREPDGALRLVGSHGVTAGQLSQWQRIPLRTKVPLTEALRTGRVVWVADRRQFAARYPDLAGEDLVPGVTVCALPLRAHGEDGDRLIGAMKIGWAERYRPSRAAEAHLAALADLTADTLARLPGPSPAVPDPADPFPVGAPAPKAPDLKVFEPAGAPWFRAVLDGLLDPVLVLRAVREPGGPVTDLVVEHANAATVDLAGRTAAELRGRRLSELYPGMVGSGAFERLRAAAEDGVPYLGEAERYVETVAGSARATAMTLHAIPFQDGLLVTWRSHDEAERHLVQAAQAARLARLGTWEWRPGERGLSCSDGVPALFGAPVGTTRLDPRTALAAVVPADRDAVRAAAADLLAGRTAEPVDFAVRAPDGERCLRALGEPTVTPDGRLLALAGVVQDVTPWRRAEQALSDTRDRLADQRRRTGGEQRAVRALQQALMGAPAGRPVTGLESAYRYLPAEREAKVGGDWYDLLDLPDGTVLLVVGDVSGHGLPAAAAMSQLRHALRGIAYDAPEPARILDRLNRILCHQRADHIAGAAVARLDPRTGRLTWARAGHLPPVLLHRDSARPLDPPAGMILGVAPRARYGTAELRLTPGDRLLLYTDGLIARRNTDLATALDRLLHACNEYRPPDLEGLLDHLLRRLGAPNPVDDTCVLAIRFTGAGTST
ncbi:SpoIIE family protein phosphatase [Kitasatospora sp. NPDC059673]|uniref:SpoIIE family protein phosphatase n=1 Tax=Kitasatospora sp. NPDC059673 TaxID=3346901 RepID=UPI0036A120C3